MLVCWCLVCLLIILTSFHPNILIGSQVDASSQSPAQQYIQLLNEEDVAVDISDWRLEGALQPIEIPAGTVISHKRSVYIAANVSEFRKRSASPKAGERVFVVGSGFQEPLLAASGPYQFQLLDSNGTRIYKELIQP